MKLHALIIVLALNCAAARGEALRITEVSVETDAVHLVWQPAHSLTIVEVSTNLISFASRGDVRSESNLVSLAPADARAYFRLHEVQVVEFPDVALHLAVHDAIVRTHGSKLAPPHNIYDVELRGIQTLDASGRGIRDFSGLEHLPDLRALDVSQSGLITLGLPVAVTTNLVALNCASNALPSLRLAGYRNLEVLHCESNRLSTLDARPCTKLRRLHCNDNAIGNRLNLAFARNLQEVVAQQNAIPDMLIGQELTAAIGISCDPSTKVWAYITGVIGHVNYGGAPLDVTLDAIWSNPLLADFWNLGSQGPALLQTLLRSSDQAAGPIPIADYVSSRSQAIYQIPEADYHRLLDNLDALDLDFDGVPVAVWCELAGSALPAIRPVAVADGILLAQMNVGVVYVTFRPGFVWFANLPDLADLGLQLTRSYQYGDIELAVPPGEEYKWVKLLCEDPAVERVDVASTASVLL